MKKVTQDEIVTRVQCKDARLEAEHHAMEICTLQDIANDLYAQHQDADGTDKHFDWVQANLIEKLHVLTSVTEDKTMLVLRQLDIVDKYLAQQEAQDQTQVQPAAEVAIPGSTKPN